VYHVHTNVLQHEHVCTTYIHLDIFMFKVQTCTYTFVLSWTCVNMYIHVCTMFRHVCTGLPNPVQVVRIPDVCRNSSLAVSTACCHAFTWSRAWPSLCSMDSILRRWKLDALVAEILPEKSDGDSYSEDSSALSENNALELLNWAAPEKDSSCEINRANRWIVTARNGQSEWM